MTGRANTDLLSGLIGLAIAVLFWWGRGDVGRLSIMFPNALLLLLLTFSTALIVKGVMRPDVRAIFAEGDRRRMVVTALALFAWGLAIPYLGFYVASVGAFLLLTCYLAAARRRVTLATIAVWLAIIAVEAGFFYLVFAKFLYVPLPAGVFF